MMRISADRIVSKKTLVLSAIYPEKEIAFVILVRNDYRE